MTAGSGDPRRGAALTDGVLPVPESRGQAVEFVAQDGVTLRGEARGHGPCWVILVHDTGHDLDVWQALTPGLGSEGFGVVSLDLRGHGASDGVTDPGMVVPDVRSVTSLLRRESTNRLALVGAGLGGFACLELAAEVGASAVVALSPRPVEPKLDGIRNSTCPKLVMVGSHDVDSLADSSVIHRSCLGWTLLRQFPVAEQGTDLIQSSWGDHVREEVLAFLRTYLAKGVRVD